jgi:hypothetical protein
MKRVAFLSIICFGLACAPEAFAQAAKATPATAPAAPPAAVAKARMATPVKGTAYIEVISSPSKLVAGEIITPLKIKNVSNGPIAGLRVDQYWYDKTTQVTGDTERVRAPIAPGEIIDVTLRAPNKPNLVNNRTMFQHANGRVDAKGVKKFTEDKK